MEKIDLFKAYFTEESKYYADKLEKYENGNKYTFNLWAGLFGVAWFLYRKMNKQALILFIILFVTTIISTVILNIINPNDSSNGIYIQLIIWITSFVIIGFVANKLYIEKSIKMIEAFEKTVVIENVDNTTMNKLRRVGGTSLKNALIFVGIMFIIQIAIKCVH
jgi:hypothetical protein